MPRHPRTFERHMLIRTLARQAGVFAIITAEGHVTMPASTPQGGIDAFVTALRADGFTLGAWGTREGYRLLEVAG
jgi:hypothetical protein